MNLKTLDLDTLSLLPKRQKMSITLSGRFESKSHGWDKNNSIYNNEVFKNAIYILKNSYGKHIDNVFSKVSKLVPSNSPYSASYLVERYVSHNERNRGWYYLSSYVNQEGIITKVEPNPYKRYKSTYDREKWLKERALQAKRNEIITTTLLKLINNKPLFQFYSKLLKNEKTILTSIADTNKFWREYNPKNYKGGKDYRRIQLPKRISSDEIKLQQVRRDIQKIENGKYNVFYESNVYLYSLQKECPHFEQVIKSESI